MIRMDSQEQAQRSIALLAAGGTVLSPLKPHPAPDDAGCGSVTRDRFGYHLSEPRKAPPAGLANQRNKPLPSVPQAPPPPIKIKN